MAKSDLRFLITSDWDGKGIKDAQRDIDGVSEKTNNMRMVATGALVAGGAAVGAFATKFAADSLKAYGSFEQGMREVFTLMPTLSGEARDKMTRDARATAVEMGRLPDEVVPALYQAISAGVPQENVFEFLRTANEAARGGVTDLETAVDGLTSVVNAYGSDVIGAAEASDLMFTAVRLGKTNFEELSASLFNVVPVAASMGVEFSTVTAALAAMTAQGVPTSVATTQLRQALVELNTEGSKVSDIFQKITGQSFREFLAGGGDLNDALQLLEDYANGAGLTVGNLFGSVEAGGAALTLTGRGAETFANNLDEMGESAGATGQAFEEMGASGEQSIEDLNAAWAGLQLATGSYIASIEELPKLISGATNILNLASGVSGDVVALQIERNAAAVGSLKEEVEDLVNMGSKFEWQDYSLEEGGLLFHTLKQSVEWVGNKWATGEVTDQVRARLDEINQELATQATSIDGYQQALAGVYGESINILTDGTAEITTSTGKVVVNLEEVYEASRDASTGLEAVVDAGTWDYANSGRGYQVMAEDLTAVEEAADLSEEALKRAMERAEAVDGAFRKGLGSNAVSDLFASQADLEVAQGGWEYQTNDNTEEIVEIQRQLNRDLTDEQAKSYQDILATVEEGGALWRQAWGMLQDDLTTKQRNELVARLEDLKLQHGATERIHTGDAEAAEDAANRIVEAQRQIREEYRQTAFESLLSQANIGDMPAVLDWAEDMGIINEGEAEARLQYAQTMAAIESRTQALADGEQVTEEYLQTMSLLTTGLFENETQAQEYAAKWDAEVVGMFIKASEKGGDLEDVLRRINFQTENRPLMELAEQSQQTPWYETEVPTLPEVMAMDTQADEGRVLEYIEILDLLATGLFEGERQATEFAERWGSDVVQAFLDASTTSQDLSSDIDGVVKEGGELGDVMALVNGELAKLDYGSEAQRELRDAVREATDEGVEFNEILLLINEAVEKMPFAVTAVNEELGVTTGEADDLRITLAEIQELIDGLPETVTVRILSNLGSLDMEDELTTEGTHDWLQRDRNLIRNRIPGYAAGGRVTGGTHGRDSVNAMLMPDEYVVTANAARTVGYDVLEQIDRTGAVPGTTSSTANIVFENYFQISGGGDAGEIAAAVREAQEESARHLGLLLQSQGVHS